MAKWRDLGAFDQRAPVYDEGWRGRLHHEIVQRTAALALSMPSGRGRVLDVGCGTGYLLRVLARRSPGTSALVGIDPAPSMVAVAASASDDGRVTFTPGAAEHLPFADGSFDLVVSTTSFDHWADQEGGLRECARVLVAGGSLVLVDQFSLLLSPTLVMGRRGKARTRRRADRLLSAAGFTSIAWHRVYAVIINAATATTRT